MLRSYLFLGVAKNRRGVIGQYYDAKTRCYVNAGAGRGLSLRIGLGIGLGLDILRHYADIRRQQHSAGRRVIVLANEAAPVISSRSAGINIAPGFSIVVLANDAAPVFSTNPLNIFSLIATTITITYS